MPLYKKRIAVNARLLLPDKLEGIGNFIHETVTRMAAALPDVEFVLLFDRPYSGQFITSDNMTAVVLPPQSRHVTLWWYWFEIAVARWLKNNPCHLFLTLDSHSGIRISTPTVLAIHDLAFEHLPDSVPFTWLLYRKYYTRKFAQKATRIVTVSSFSAQDIAERYKIDMDKIDVAFNGVKSIYKPLTESEKQISREYFSGGQPYFIYAGSLNGRKNLARLLRAFDKFEDATNSNCRLVVAGAKGWKNSEMNDTLRTMHHRDKVKFTGSLSDADMALAIGGAEAMLYVSLFEGFGVPLLEAMQCGVPCITSDVSAMPEIAGDAALLVNPFSEEEISGAMQKLYSDDVLKKLLIDAGYKRAKNFSWENTASLLWKSCEKAMQASVGI